MNVLFFTVAAVVFLTTSARAEFTCSGGTCSGTFTVTGGTFDSQPPQGMDQGTKREKKDRGLTVWDVGIETAPSYFGRAQLTLYPKNSPATLAGTRNVPNSFPIKSGIANFTVSEDQCRMGADCCLVPVIKFDDGNVAWGWHDPSFEKQVGKWTKTCFPIK